MNCKCGSDTHQRTTSRKCPLYIPRPGKEKPKSTNDIKYRKILSVYKQGFTSFCKDKKLYDNVLITVCKVSKISYFATKLLQFHLLGDV